MIPAYCCLQGVSARLSVPDWGQGSRVRELCLCEVLRVRVSLLSEIQSLTKQNIAG